MGVTDDATVQATQQNVKISTRDWETDAEGATSGAATLASAPSDFGEDITASVMLPSASPRRTFCSRRGPHIAVATVVLAALAAVVAVMFIRSHSSNTFPVPEKFTASVVAYEKLPNGDTYGSPLFNATAHRNGDALRSVGEFFSAGRTQMHRFTSVDAVAAYQVFDTDLVLDEEEDDAPIVGPDAQASRVACVQPGDAPAITDIKEALQHAVAVSEQDMIDLVGPGACAGDVDRYMVEFADITAVVCVVDSLRFEVVSEEFVAYVDGTTQVDTVAMDKISIPAKPDGQALSCPSLSGVVARAADSFALSRRLGDVQDCIENAANNPLLGNCASVTGALSECRVPAYLLYWGLGLFYWSCVPHDCSSWELTQREAGENVLCLPLESDRRLVESRFLGKKKKEDENKFMTRLVVPREKRVAKCTSKHRTPVKHCVFLHGAGVPDVPGSFGSSFENSFPWYWGPVHHYVKDFCTDVRFIHLPTADKAWDDPSLGDHFCYWAATRGDGNIADAAHGEITNTLLFVHGSGNLIAAKAFNEGKCSVGDSSHWFEIQDGDHLSRMAKWNLDFCDEVSNDPQGAALDSELEKAAAKYAEIKGSSKKLSKSSKKAWDKWRGSWKKSFDGATWEALTTRQRQRKLVAELGACKTVSTPPLSFAASKYTFEQNQGWQSLHQSADAGAFPSRVDTDGLKELATTINTGVSGSMCAVLSDNARHRAIFHDVKPTNWDNIFEPYDVFWSRCWGKSQYSTFRPNPRHHSYNAITSFYEATCRFGNPTGEPKDGVNKPCDWYMHMACAYGTVDGGGSSLASYSVDITDDSFLTDEEKLAQDQNDATAP